VGAVVFGCDGVLADTEPHSRSAWRSVLSNLGHPATSSDVEGCTGLGYSECYDRLADVAPLPPSADLWSSVLEALIASFSTGLLRFEDAANAVESLVLLGVPIAVASSSPRERLDVTLSAIGLAGRFDVTVAGDEVERSKPAPDVYLAAARLLGVAPGDCVAVEDSGHGATAAVAAGMRVIGVVRDDEEAGRLLSAGAALVTEIDADDLARWV